MKKMFLSLATITFVATGALTVTSCGGDDSTTPVIPTPTPDDTTPTPDDTPGESAGVFNVGNSTYALDMVETHLAAEGQTFKIYSLELNDGSVVRATRWDIIAYNGDDMAASANYHQVRLYIEVGENDAIVTPPQAEGFIFGGAVVYAGNASTAVNLGQLSNAMLGFATYVEGSDEGYGQIAYGAQFSSANEGTITLEYDGDMDGTYLVPDTTSAKSTKVSTSDLSKLKSVDGGKIRLSDVKL